MPRWHIWVWHIPNYRYPGKDWQWRRLVGKNDSFEIRCWSRALRLPRTARKTNGWVREQIQPETWLETKRMKWKLSYFEHVVKRQGSLGKITMLGEEKAAGKEELLHNVKWTYSIKKATGRSLQVLSRPVKTGPRGPDSSIGTPGVRAESTACHSNGHNNILLPSSWINHSCLLVLTCRPELVVAQVETWRRKYYK